MRKLRLAVLVIGVLTAALSAQTGHSGTSKSTEFNNSSEQVYRAALTLVKTDQHYTLVENNDSNRSLNFRIGFRTGPGLAKYLSSGTFSTQETTPAGKTRATVRISIFLEPTQPPAFQRANAAELTEAKRFLSLLKKLLAP